jgi:hypothetical protein
LGFISKKPNRTETEKNPEKNRAKPSQTGKTEPKPSRTGKTEPKPEKTEPNRKNRTEPEKPSQTGLNRFLP